MTGGESKGREERGKEMEDTAHDSVESGDPRERSAEEMATFVRPLGAADCFFFL